MSEYPFDPKNENLWPHNLQRYARAQFRFLNPPFAFLFLMFFLFAPFEFDPKEDSIWQLILMEVGALAMVILLVQGYLAVRRTDKSITIQKNKHSEDSPAP